LAAGISQTTSRRVDLPVRFAGLIRLRNEYCDRPDFKSGLPAMKELRGLTSLRGIAALYVVVYHFSNTIAHTQNLNFKALVPRGHIAVDLFFVLSGFVMAYTYAADFRQHGIKAYSSFLSKRAARILPLNIFIVTILLLLRPLEFDGKWFSNWTAICNLGMIQGLNVCYNINIPSWSVSLEWFSYLAFPVLLTLCIFSRRDVLFLAIFAAVAGLVALCSHKTPLSTDSFSLGAWWGIVRCVSEFSLGLAAYRLYQSGRFKALLSSDRFLSGLTLSIIVIAAGHLGDLFAALLFPVLIVAIAHNNSLGARLLGSYPLHFLGVISYSLYMIHHPLLRLEIYLASIVHPSALSVPACYAFIIAGSLSVIVPSWITYSLVERPSRSFLRSGFLALRPSSFADSQ
jgi:peptidoglycan/LPS O-acetylase OafA/YrhL